MDRCNFYQDIVKFMADHVDHFSDYADKVERSIVDSAIKTKERGSDWFTVKSYQQLGSYAAQLSRLCFSISYKVGEDLTAMNTRTQAYVGKGITIKGDQYDKAKEEAMKKENIADKK